MKKPYSAMTIERLESTVANHEKTLKALQKPQVKKGYDPEKYKKKLYRAEWRLKTAKKWLQKRTDERDMKNH